MARTTHDRQRDHRGTDLDSNIELDGATTTYSDGDDLHTVVADIDDRIISGGGGSQYIDILTGDSSNFDGSIGNWTAVGSASVAYDSAVQLLGTTYGSLKITATTNSATKGGSVPVPGTFLAGHLYEAVLVVKGATVGGGNYTGWVVNFGDAGASDFSDGPFLRYRDVGDTDTGVWHRSDTDMLIRGLWRPSADRTTVTVKVRRDPFDDNVSQDLWVLLARVVEIREDMPLLSATLGIVQGEGLTEVGSTENGGKVGFSRSLLRTGARFSTPQYGESAEMRGMVDIDGNYSSVGAYSTGVYSYGNQSAIGRRSYSGINDEFGPDYVGLVYAERSATEVEIAPDYPYDVVIIDGGDNSDTTHFWFTENADGTEKSALNLLHYLKHGTADPSAGGGVASAVGSFYGRDNSGVGELWVKTGASNTAWTKVTIP